MKHLESGLAPDVRQRLEAYGALLLRWTRRINLIAAADTDHIWTRHILDSAQLGALLPTRTGELVDLGSGGGLPGLVLALTTGWHVHLVESDQRKAAFLREAVRETKAPATVHPLRVEALRLAPMPVVTARAFAPLDRLLGLAVPLLDPRGVCLLPKGRNCQGELTAAAPRWHMQVERFPSRTSPGATLLRVSEIRRAGPAS